MQRINFQDGQKTSSAKVTIDNVDYPVTPARYTGATPLSSLVMNTMQTNIENAINQNVDNIGGEDYDNTATYEEGDIVKYEGQLYICIEAIDTPEEWDSTKWNATDVLSSAGGNEVAIGDSTAVTSKTKIWVDTDDETDVFSEVVDSLSGNELNKAPSVHAIKQALSYSTDEVVIGTWIDGKPLYRKVFTNISYTAGTQVTINHNIGNIDKIFVENAFIWKPSTKLSRSINYFIGGSSSYIQATKDSIFILVSSDQNPSDATIDVILNYTKTTD